MFPPLWQIRMPVGMMNFPIYWKIKHVPNHQPENLLRWWFMHHHSHIHTHTKKNDPAMNQSFTTPTPFMSCMSQHVPSTLSGPCGKCPSCSFRTANCCGWCPINATQLTWWVAFTLQIHRNPTETNKQKLGKNYIYIHIYIYTYIYIYVETIGCFKFSTARVPAFYDVLLFLQDDSATCFRRRPLETSFDSQLCLEKCTGTDPVKGSHLVACFGTPTRTKSYLPETNLRISHSHFFVVPSSKFT